MSIWKIRKKRGPMTKKYKVRYKVEKIYNVEVEIDNPPKSPEELSDSIYDLITDDYEVSNMDSDLADETYSIEKVEEINDKDL